MSDTIGGGWFQRAGGVLTVVCAGLAAAADLDLLFGAHRMATHSITAAVLVGVCAGLFAEAFGVSGQRTVARVALTCAAAYGSHLLLDWLAVDSYPPRGLQLLWPFDRGWYISNVDLFRQTARQHMFARGPLRANVRAILQEIAIVGPVVVALWLVRIKALARLAPEVSGGDHPAK